MNEVKKLTFTEDEFDLHAYKNAASAKIREKAQYKHNNRKIFVGKIILAPVAVFTSVALYYFLSVLFNVLFNA